MQTEQIPVLKADEYPGGIWYYEPHTYQPYRYVLGRVGTHPLVCIGINPSTAQPGALDPTLKSVERLAAANGFDSWIMFNVYPQRATDPNDMDRVPDRALCDENLRWPWQLSDAARDAYRDFLKTNTWRVLTLLLKAQDTEGIKALLALDVMDADAFAEGAALAAKADNAEAAALLADAEHKKRAAAPQKKRYDFDF